MKKIFVGGFLILGVCQVTLAQSTFGVVLGTVRDSSAAVVAGATTPYALIATLPGVQPDNGNGFSIQGGLPSLLETSVDGISVTNVTGNSPNRNLFPSVESISEIKVQGVGNTAEYGAPGDITTTSKSGTNQFHGAGFWYLQNRAFDARSF